MKCGPAPLEHFVYSNSYYLEQKYFFFFLPSLYCLQQYLSKILCSCLPCYTLEDWDALQTSEGTNSLQLCLCVGFRSSDFSLAESLKLMELDTVLKFTACKTTEVMFLCRSWETELVFCMWIFFFQLTCLSEDAFQYLYGNTLVLFLHT